MKPEPIHHGAKDSDSIVLPVYLSGRQDVSTGTRKMTTDDYDGFYLYAFSGGIPEQYFDGSSASGKEPKLSLTAGKVYNIYALANTGNAALPSDFADEEEFLRYRFGDEGSAENAMAGSVKNFSASEGRVVEVEMERLYARIVFELQNNVPGCRLRNVRLGGCARSMAPFETGSVSYDALEPVRVPDAMLDKVEAGLPLVMYALENCHGVLLPSNDNPLRKEPASIGGEAASCTWLEAEVDVSETSYLNGILRYRVYLGDDDCRDFSVRRNTTYAVTLDLSLRENSASHIESCWKFDRSGLSGKYYVQWERRDGRIGPGQYDVLHIIDGYGDSADERVWSVSSSDGVKAEKCADGVRVDYLGTGGHNIYVTMTDNEMIVVPVACFKPKLATDTNSLSLDMCGTPSELHFSFLDPSAGDAYIPDYSTDLLSVSVEDAREEIGWDNSGQGRLSLWLKRFLPTGGRDKASVTLLSRGASNTCTLEISVPDVFSGINEKRLYPSEGGKVFESDVLTTGKNTDLKFEFEDAELFRRNSVSISDFTCSDIAAKGFVFGCNAQWGDGKATLSLPYYSNGCKVPCGICSFRYLLTNMWSGETYYSQLQYVWVVQKAVMNIFGDIDDFMSGAVCYCWDYMFLPCRDDDVAGVNSQLEFVAGNVQICGISTTGHTSDLKLYYHGAKRLFPPGSIGEQMFLNPGSDMDFTWEIATFESLHYWGEMSYDSVGRWLEGLGNSSYDDSSALSYEWSMLPYTVCRRTLDPLTGIQQSVPYFHLEEGRYIGSG
ncbi:MAG: DUF4906 domain-containing protein [Bacteroidales bacterium]|nr:DUF4906 domain-containing protein [Bacteroidales bacterium]